MTQKIYQVDAFSDSIFAGNPAAVCPLDKWLPDEILQSIAMENNLAETAFYVITGDGYTLRWFTPTVEVDLCGHATLAAAYVLFNYENFNGTKINFFSPRSGPLTVTRNGELLTLNFPTDYFREIEISDDILACFNVPPQKAFKGKTDFMLVYGSEQDIRTIEPHMDAISRMDGRGVIITAKGDTVDFVSRFFAPQSGVPEDPVTGSAHTTLTPYWSKELGKSDLTAIQVSKRKGQLFCRNLMDRVEISGKGSLYLKGEIFL